MIQGLMHVLNEVKRRVRLYPGLDSADFTVENLLDLESWLQEEIDREIEAMAKHHSEKESADLDSKTLKPFPPGFFPKETPPPSS